MTKREDLTGRVFGRWIVEGPAPLNKHQAMMWMCLCKCGTRRAVTANYLLNMGGLSCGCHTRDVTSARTIKDETGHTYGYWTVLKFSHSAGHLAFWLCECACGTSRTICGVDLRRRNGTLSCTSCSRRRRAELASKGGPSYTATPARDPLWAPEKDQG